MPPDSGAINYNAAVFSRVVAPQLDMVLLHIPFSSSFATCHNTSSSKSLQL